MLIWSWQKNFFFVIVLVSPFRLADLIRSITFNFLFNINISLWLLFGNARPYVNRNKQKTISITGPNSYLPSRFNSF